jgi:hypothetical protein
MSHSEGHPFANIATMHPSEQFAERMPLVVLE